MNFENEVLDVLHQRILKLRNIENLVSQRDFKRLFEVSDVQHEVLRAINIFDDFAVRDWFKHERQKTLGMLGIRELRQIASNLGVLGYNKLIKPLLLSEIVRLQNVRASRIESASRNEGPNGQGGNNGSSNPTGY